MRSTVALIVIAKGQSQQKQHFVGVTNCVNGILQEPEDYITGPSQLRSYVFTRYESLAGRTTLGQTRLPAEIYLYYVATSCIFVLGLSLSRILTTDYTHWRYLRVW